MTERPEIFPGNPDAAPGAPDIAPGDPERIIAPGESPDEYPFGDPMESPTIPIPSDPAVPPDANPDDVPPEMIVGEPFA